MTTHPAAGLALALALLAAALPAPAAADACDADAQRLCSLIPAGGGRILACLQSNYNNLSDECRADLDRARQLAYEVGLTCQADVFAYCQNVRPGQYRVLSCLVGHYDQISSGCKDGLALLKRFQDDCGADVAAICPSLPAGDAQLLTCLLAQKSKLSRACRTLLAGDD